MPLAKSSQVITVLFLSVCALVASTSLAAEEVSVLDEVKIIDGDTIQVPNAALEGNTLANSETGTFSFLFGTYCSGSRCVKILDGRVTEQMRKIGCLVSGFQESSTGVGMILPDPHSSEYVLYQNAVLFRTRYCQPRVSMLQGLIGQRLVA